MINRFRKSIAGFVVLSVLFHIVFVLVLQVAKAPVAKPTKQIVEIEYVTSKNQTKALQLIEQDEKRLNEDEPDKEAYLGRHTQRVVKETKAARHGDFKNSSGQGLPNQAKQEQLPSEQKEKKKAMSKAKYADGSLPSLGDLKPTFKPSMQRKYDDIPVGQGGEASATNDHLKKVETGIETMLNSREFVYYTYYQRIRTQLRQYWEPSIRGKVSKIFAQGRSIASTKDHITRVVIVLNDKGTLMKVQVVGESGVTDLDDAAVEAFRAAEPFPNPPKGMMEADGSIRIQWDFILES